MPLYFAFGSNMLLERLRRRCPDISHLGVARADGWTLNFSKRSDVDGSGKATLAGSRETDVSAHGVIFEISERQLVELDRIEGVGSGYDRFNDLKIEFLASGERAIASTYLASDGHIDQSLKPFHWYHALVVAGARQASLPKNYVAFLQSHGFTQDLDDNRVGFREAREVLKASGYPLIPAL